MPQTQEKNEKMLEEAQQLVGQWSEEIVYKYPVEYEPISRYCDMIDDDNPLFTDPEYARKSKHGDVIMPPLAPFGIMMKGFEKIMLSRMPETPGKFFINLGLEYEFYKNLMIGDRIIFSSRLANIEIKKTRMDPMTWFITLEFLYKNQKGEKACLVRSLAMSHRAPEEVAATG